MTTYVIPKFTPFSSIFNGFWVLNLNFFNSFFKWPFSEYCFRFRHFLPKPYRFPLWMRDNNNGFSSKIYQAYQLNNRKMLLCTSLVHNVYWRYALVPIKCIAPKKKINNKIWTLEYRPIHIDICLIMIYELLSDCYLMLIICIKITHTMSIQ